MSEASQERLLSYREVRERVKLSRNTLRKMEREGHFPLHREIPGTKLTGWLASEVEAWLRALPPAQCVAGVNATRREAA